MPRCYECETQFDGTICPACNPGMVRRGEIIGERQGEPVKDEAEHFYKCEECGGWVDMRDLGSVFDHEAGGSHPRFDRADQ